MLCYMELKYKVRSSWSLDRRFYQYDSKGSGRIKKVDYKGYFEADDEVGQIFNQIKATVSQLDRFKGEEQ